jgi:hypothetical protein
MLKDTWRLETKLNYYSLKMCNTHKSVYCTIKANVSLQQGVPFEYDRSVRRSWCQVVQTRKLYVRFQCPVLTVIYLP